MGRNQHVGIWFLLFPGKVMHLQGKNAVLKPAAFCEFQIFQC